MTKPEAAPTKRYLKIREASEYLGVSENSLRNFMSQGLIPICHLHGTEGTVLRQFVRLDVQDLDKFMQSRKESHV